jgi:hypothetical protein
LTIAGTRTAGGILAVGLVATISLCDVYRIGVFDDKGRGTRLRFGATRTAWRFICLRVVIDATLGLAAFVLAPGMRFRANVETALDPTISDAVYGAVAALGATAILRPKPRARYSSGHLSRGFREWLLSFRQFADDRIAEKCYVAVSQWKRRTAVPAILRLEVDTVRGHFWDWLDRYSRLDSGTVRETKATVTAALHDSDQTVEHIVSTIIETFLALPRSDECVSQIVRIGQHDGQPNAFAVSRTALLVNRQPSD